MIDPEYYASGTDTHYPCFPCSLFPLVSCRPGEEKDKKTRNILTKIWRKDPKSIHFSNRQPREVLKILIATFHWKVFALLFCHDALAELLGEAIGLLEECHHTVTVPVL